MQSRNSQIAGQHLLPAQPLPPRMGCGFPNQIVVGPNAAPLQALPSGWGRTLVPDAMGADPPNGSLVIKVIATHH